MSTCSEYHTPRPRTYSVTWADGWCPPTRVLLLDLPLPRPARGVHAPRHTPHSGWAAPGSQPGPSLHYPPAYLKSSQSFHGPQDKMQPFTEPTEPVPRAALCLPPSRLSRLPQAFSVPRTEQAPPCTVLNRDGLPSDLCMAGSFSALREATPAPWLLLPPMLLPPTISSRSLSPGKDISFVRAETLPAHQGVCSPQKQWVFSI